MAKAICKFEENKSCHGSGVFYFVLLSFPHKGESQNHKMAILFFGVSLLFMIALSICELRK
jgi:hypothetical protein